MDGDISKGPMLGWQKKLNGSSANLNSALSTSTAAAASNKTPQNNSSINFKGKSPGILFFLLSMKWLHVCKV